MWWVGVNHQDNFMFLREKSGTFYLNINFAYAIQD